MRVVTPQITWHNRDPVLCVDFDPSSGPDADKGTGETYRLATGGSDSHVLIWHLKDSSSPKAEFGCVADLTRHTKAVNTLRFSPCGKCLASADDDGYVYIWKNDTEKYKPGEEVWTVDKALRKHLDDVCDMSWSADSGRLATTSVDNSAIVWDIKKGIPIHNLSEHVGFVQGAAMDPLGKFVATVATDRWLRLFNTDTGKLELKTLKYPSKWLPKEKKTPVKDLGDSKPDNIPKKSLQPFTNRLFHDDTLKSYCRRLNFSPKGEFLVVPGGILPAKRENDNSNSPSGESGLDIKNSKKEKEKPISDRNAVVIFCRNSFTNPCSVIPTGTSYSIAVRFCPTYFQRSRDVITYDKNFINPAKKSERLVTCVGRLKNRKEGKKSLLHMPYRLVFAVSTNDSVLISDTDSTTPLAIIRNIHVTRMSDLSWSGDGRVLVVSSTDGYCSVISFEQNELGVPFTEEIDFPSSHAFSIPPPIVKEKVTKPVKVEPLKAKDITPKASKTKKKEPTIKTTTPIKIIPKFFQGSFKHKMRKVDVTTLAKLGEGGGAGVPPPPVLPTLPILQLDKIDSVEMLLGAEREKTSTDEVCEVLEKDKDSLIVSSVPKPNTFLERWLKKTTVANNLPTTSVTSKSCANTVVSFPVPPLQPSPLKPIDVPFNSKVTELSVSMSESELPSTTTLKPLISPEQLYQLKNAPIKVDMEADEAENEASVILSSESDGTVTIAQVVGTGDTRLNDSTPSRPGFPPITTTPTFKRQATSPLSSHPKPKQPRRVEFITLSK